MGEADRASWRVAAAGVVLAVLVAATSATAQDDARYGVIGIGSSDVVARAFSVRIADVPPGAPLFVDRAMLEGERPVRILGERTRAVVNPVLPENVERTADAARELVDWLFAEHEVAAEQVFVVGGASVTETAHASDLGLAVVRRTGRPVDFLTSERQAALTFDGATPWSRRGDAVVIDVDAGGVRAAYVDRFDGAAATVGLALLDTGPLPLLDEVVAANAGVPPEDLPGALAEVADARLAPAVYRAGLNHPPLRNRSRVYLAGAPAGALIATARPDAIAEAWTRIGRADVEAFYAQAISARPFAADLEGVRDPDLRAQAASAAAALADRYTADHLIAQAQFLRSLFDALELQGREAVFVSSRAGLGGDVNYLARQLTGAATPATD